MNPNLNSFSDVSHLITLVLRRWWLVVGMTLLAALVAFVVSARATPVYEATTSLMVGRIMQSAEVDRYDMTIGAELALSYATIALRQPVLQAVVDALALPYGTDQLKTRVRAKPVEGTQLLEIKAQANSPEAAQQIADEVAHQLILLSPTPTNDAEAMARREFIRQRLQQLEFSILSTQERLDSLESTVSDAITALPPQKLLDLQAQVDTLSELLARYEDNYASLLALLNSGHDSLNNLSLVEPARARARPIRPRTPLNVLVLALVGAAAGVGIVFVLEFLDRSLKSPDEVQTALGVMPLGAVAQIKGRTDRDRLLIHQRPDANVIEDYRLLRSKLEFMMTDWTSKRILITSPNQGEGKSLTVANLAMVMAQAGYNTLIVDADLRHPCQHEIFQLPQASGLVELLRSTNINVEAQAKETSIKNLRVLTSGTIPANPAKVLDSTLLGDALDRLGQFADVVICDTAQAVDIADAPVLAGKVDGVLLVINMGRTQKVVAEQAMANLTQAGANMLGTVLNRASAGTRASTVFNPPATPAVVQNLRSSVQVGP